MARQCGQSNVLPFLSRQLRKLFKMCKQTNKHMFATGFGMAMLTYFCATHCANIHVINGGQKGSAIEEIAKLPDKVLAKLTKGDVFLDYTSGDYYSYKPEINEWQPEGNVSLHYTKKSTMLTSISSYLRKQKTYKPKTLPELYQIYRSRNDEALATIKKPYIQHWLFEGIAQQFLVLHETDWEVHPVNVTQVSNVKRNYMTLCDSDKGPVIAEHENSIVMQTCLNKKYPETLKVLSNYVKHTLIELFAKGRIDITVAMAEKQLNETFLPTNRESIEKRKKRQVGYSAFNTYSGGANHYKDESKFTTLFAYSGLNYSKRRGFLVVKNNAVAGKSIKTQGSMEGIGGSPHNSPKISRKQSTWTMIKPKETKPSFLGLKEDTLLSKNSLSSPSMNTMYDSKAIQKILHPNMPEEFMGQLAKEPVFRESKYVTAKKESKKIKAERYLIDPISIRIQTPYYTYRDIEKQYEKVLWENNKSIGIQREMAYQKRIYDNYRTEKRVSQNTGIKVQQTHILKVITYVFAQRIIVNCNVILSISYQ
eukprot:TRINITY_DN256_c0_g1_i1.p1 TRINITY_DN256_c0_g1~~TRINITY_DN256_c0_g1_i1.p1  ORF type:complete len:536 (-),score=48.68 TRINITY_DN256_c0_g1_i1:265-1872(-)